MNRKRRGRAITLLLPFAPTLKSFASLQVCIESPIGIIIACSAGPFLSLRQHTFEICPQDCFLTPKPVPF